MTSTELRKKFLNFFKERGHVVVPSSSLVPVGDDSVLFTTAGMQQFKPYYTGAKDALEDFGSLNTVTVQKCVRTGDIDDVGDDTHLTFFEMLGNFSFGYKPGEPVSSKGGYWKKEVIEYAHEFITKELGLEIDYVSVFKDEESGIPADEESREIWLSINPNLKIKDHKKEDNFWGPTGDEGPCGPTTEIYINGVEIWNIVFNEYYKSKDGKYTPLDIKGIDTGMGLERLLVQVQKKNNVYETDLFNGEKTKEERVVADHVKASLFMLSDGVLPSNKGQGYVLRKLMRTVASLKKNISETVDNTFNKYKEIYNIDKVKFIYEFSKERDAYENTRVATRKALEPIQQLTGYIAYGISSTLGTRPADILQEATELKIPLSVNINEEIIEASKQHQEKSRTASAGMFKGGLQNHEPKTIKLHTAHHLLLAGLQNVISKDIKQRGSNINEERLRMDFLCDHKLADEEKKKVEDWVNDKIQKGFKVVRKEMPLSEAEKLGAEMEFGAKYPEIVSVYIIEDKEGNIISKEFCGGPHVSDSSELGTFKIQKEEAVAQGIRRIKATLS